MGLLRSTIRIIDRFVEITGSYMMVTMVLIVFWQVFGRYVLHHIPSWSEEIALLLMMWFGFLSIAIGFRHQLHIRISLVTDKLPSWMQAAAEWLTIILIIGFGILLIVEGYKFTILTWATTLPVTKLPSGLQYLIIPVTGGLTVIYGFAMILDRKVQAS